MPEEFTSSEQIKYQQPENHKGVFGKLRSPAPIGAGLLSQSSAYEQPQLPADTPPQRVLVLPQVEPQVLPQVLPQVEPQVLPQVEPQVLPQVEPQVLPQVEPQVPQQQPQQQQLHVGVLSVEPETILQLQAQLRQPQMRMQVKSGKRQRDRHRLPATLLQQELQAIKDSPF